MLLHEVDELCPRDASVLRTGDAVAFESAAVEPLADRSRGNLADLGDLACGEDGGGSNVGHKGELVPAAKMRQSARVAYVVALAIP